MKDKMSHLEEEMKQLRMKIVTKTDSTGLERAQVKSYTVSKAVQFDMQAAYIIII